MGRAESGGIPWDTIYENIDDKKLKGEITGDSGRLLGYNYKTEGAKVEFEIRDMVDPTFHLTTNVDSIGGVLTLSLNTRDHDDHDRRHPDMYAGGYVAHVLEILKRRSIVPCEFQGVWSDVIGYNDNYLQFHSIYDRKKDNRVDAARCTWSGRTLGRYFPNISYRDVSIEPAQVLAIFKR